MMPTKVSIFPYASGALVFRSDSAIWVCWINSELPTILIDPYAFEGTPVVADKMGVKVIEAVADGVDAEDTSDGGAGERVAVDGTGENVTVGDANVDKGCVAGIALDVLQALKYSKAKLGPITHRRDL
jgi:hypothetical protein